MCMMDVRVCARMCMWIMSNSEFSLDSKQSVDFAKVVHILFVWFVFAEYGRVYACACVYERHSAPAIVTNFMRYFH